MKRYLLVALFLSIIFISSISVAGDVYKWDDPALYDGSLYGKVVIVEGIIITTYNSGKACFLNFHENYKKYFTAVIFKSDFRKFDTPEDDYYLKKVRITGMLKEYKGKPEIIVKKPGQIEVIN